MMKNRKHLWIVSFLLALCACAIFAACNKNDGPTGGDEPAAVETISISNESALTAEWILGSADRTVHVTFTPETLTEENTQFTVESSDTDVVTVNGKSIKAVGAGTSTITVKAGDATDSVNVTVSIGDPTIEVAGDTVNAVEGIATSVQNLVLAEACDGTDLTDSVELTFDDTDNITYDEEKGTVTFAEVGEYELTFTVADPRDAAKTASVDVVVNVARNPITTSNVDFSYSNMYGDESAQTVSTSSGELAYAYYNTTASKLYYAEATFDIGSPHQGVQVGLGHFIPGNTKRMVGMGVDRGDRNFKIKDIDWIKTPNPDFQEGNPWTSSNGAPYAEANYALYNYRLAEFRGLTDDDASHVKFAVARVDDMMYAFVNDQYVASVVFDYYRIVDTVPGIIGTMWSTTQVSGMSWLSGSEAQAKIDSLIGDGQMINAYSPDSWALNSMTNFATCVDNIGADENGLKYDYTSINNIGNDSMVSPYIYFEGDFTFEWIYKNTGKNDNPTYGKAQMYLEVRDWRAITPIFNLGERRNDSKFLLDKLPDASDSEVTDKWYQPDFGDFDFSEGTRYTVTRTLGESAATYVLTVTSVANPSQTYSRTIEYSGARWSEPAILIWKNEFVSGEYSGIKWEAFDEDAPTDPLAVSITNKSALASEWILGEGARTVDIAFTPDNFMADVNYEDYTVTSSNTDAVTVNGRTLTAVGVGKTTITVQAGDATDSVEVFVMESMPTGIEISNESELTATWVVGDADRTVHVTFTPGDLTEDTAPFTVESSDPEVIRADGKKLVAVGAGTATITVKVGDATDTVEITISLADPTITAEDPIDVVYDKTYDLSDLVAVESCDGIDLSDSVEVSFSQDGITYDEDNGTISFGHDSAEYTVTFTVSDPRDGSFTATKTVTFKVYRNPLGTSNYEFTFSNVADGDAAQTATIDRDNLAYAYYNTTASKLYYAEATFDIKVPHAGVQVGLGHFIPDDTTRMIAMGVDRGDRNFKIKDIDWDKTPNPSFDENEAGSYADVHQPMFMYQLSNQLGKEDANAGHVKFAVARVGNLFYAFVNDQYVASVSYNDYLDKDTVPGIIGMMWTTTSISGMNWLSGEDAQTKIDSLLANGEQIGPYVPYDWAMNSKTTFADSVKNLSKDENGISFDYTSINNHINDSMVSPYVYFEGDFTLEWVYKFDSKNDNPTEGKAQMYLEVRNWKYGTPLLNLGERRNDNKFLLDREPDLKDEEVPEGKYDQPAFDSFDGGFDFSQGTKYTLTRTLSDTAATYTMTVTSVANPEQTHSRTFVYEKSDWNEPVLFLWHNTFVAGSYSQITWSVPDKTASAG
ncbi:MAG TPA: hypothetical protein H9708_08060 [Candidatus Borkfalkia stercoripullorum]|nr:hypothetical protein [Candidatus Borkfalkia stercoripullorum]